MSTDLEPLPALASIEEILSDLRSGRMVVIVDDEDRENEGDLLLAATKVRPEDINFMARYGRGLICLTLTRERCEALRLPLMVAPTAGGDGARRTHFTVSIEAVEGVTTGISAHDRARTIRAAVAPNASPEDLRQPGHVFPLMAQPGGVLTRAGHTEAGCDLARLAGLEPAAVIVEILNEDGTMARRPQLARFAREHGLRVASIADLISYRLEHEPSVERVDEGSIDTSWGRFRWIAYDDPATRNAHLALVYGDLAASDAPLVRVHLPGTLEDLLGVRVDSGWSLSGALERIARGGAGVLVLLRYDESKRQLLESLRRAVPGVAPSVEPGARERGLEGEAPLLRTYGTGAQILRDLAIRRMRVLGTPKHLSALSGFGLEAVEFLDPDS